MANDLPDKDSFFGGLWDTIKTGAQGTKAAFEQDIEDVKNLRLPRSALKDLAGMLTVYQNPAMGSFLPPVPTYYTLRQFYSKIGETDPQYALDLFKEAQMFGKDLDMVRPTGEFIQAAPPLNKLLGNK